MFQFSARAWIKIQSRVSIANTTSIYLFQVNKKPNWIIRKICLKLTTKTPQWCHCLRSCVFIMRLETDFVHCLLTFLTSALLVFIVDFEQVNTHSDISKTCTLWIRKEYFVSWFSFTSIHDSHDSRRSGGYSFNSSLPLSPASQALRQ